MKKLIIEKLKGWKVNTLKAPRPKGNKNTKKLRLFNNFDNI